MPVLRLGSGRRAGRGLIRGPAAAAAVPFSIGSDTSGSIMMPSAWTGITGLRPTYGRVSRAGAMTLSWSVDRLGPMLPEQTAAARASIPPGSPRADCYAGKVRAHRTDGGHRPDADLRPAPSAHDPGRARGPLQRAAATSQPPAPAAPARPPCRRPFQEADQSPTRRRRSLQRIPASRIEAKVRADSRVLESHRWLPRRTETSAVRCQRLAQPQVVAAGVTDGGVADAVGLVDGLLEDLRPGGAQRLEGLVQVVDLDEDREVALGDNLAHHLAVGRR